MTRRGPNDRPVKTGECLRCGADSCRGIKLSARGLCEYCEANAALRDTIRRVEEWRAMTTLDSDQDATLHAALAAPFLWACSRCGRFGPVVPWAPNTCGWICRDGCEAPNGGAELELPESAP